ncbi:MAG: AAA family ATPase [Thermoleophilia bacterium]|nr:AAA family ATPase [Thermoleophilia bacterium]
MSRADLIALAARLREAIGAVYLGNPQAIDRLVGCLLARGHCLIEDVPGVGKTLLANALARAVDCSFSRIQLTPDMLPADILGAGIYRRETGGFEFRPGPIFANIVLADEVNRATPRTQAALLEAMNEAAVTVDSATHRLGPPFMLVATQNPTTFEGTFTLPENQLDRFLMRITLRPSASGLAAITPILTAKQVVELQAATDAVRLDETLIDYIIAIAAATRTHEALTLGLSPRGGLSLAQAARATALLSGRDYVIPDDITDNLAVVVAHRVIARPDAAQSPREVERLVESIAQAVPSPV